MNKPPPNEIVKAASSRIRAANRARASANSASSTTNQSYTTHRNDQLERELPGARLDEELRFKIRQRLKELSDRQYRQVMPILNPGHGSNTSQNAEPIPDSSANQVRLFASSWQKSVSFTGAEIEAAGSNGVSFYNLPFFEVPFAYCSSFASNGPTVKPRLVGMAAPNTFPDGELDGASNCAYLKNNRVFALRCIGKSMTITNTTPPMYLAGSCTVGRKGADIDCNAKEFKSASNLATSDFNFKTVQALPNGPDEVSRLTGTTDTWEAKHGAYIISHHRDYDWTLREDLYNKCFEHIYFDIAGDSPPDLVNSCVKVNFIGQAEDYVYSSTDKRRIMYAGGPDHMDIPMANFTGLSTTQGASFSVKCCMLYEFILKGDANYEFSRVRTPDVPLFNFLKDFESRMVIGGYYADANFWDKVWKTFKNLWSKGGGDIATRLINSAVPGLGSAVGTGVDILTKL